MILNRIQLIVSVLGLAAAATFAQNPCKMNFDLVKKSQNRSAQNEQVTVFVKGDVAQLRSALPALGGTFRYFAGDIASVSLPVKSISLLAEKSFVRRVEAYIPHVKMMSDSMRIKTNVDAVHAGQFPLPKGYDGSGVVVGIIDSGTDFNHPDFKDTVTGKTRIKFIWDQAKPDSVNTPSAYNYGQEWDNTQIDAGLCTHTDLKHSGHGTLSSGISAGNGKNSPNHKYRGVAPGADLIVVAYDFENPKTTGIADAVDYIFYKAQLMGKPCVINASLGDYYGSHDGRNLEAQMISNLLNAAPGRAMAAASGNEGNKRIHLGYNVSTTDTNFTWFQQNNSFGGSPVDMEMWGERTSFKNIQFSVGADKVSPNYSFRGKMPFTTITPNIGIFGTDSLMNNGNRLGIIETYGDTADGVYYFTFYITPDSTSYNWRLITTGSGRFDLWAMDGSRSENTEIVNNGLPSVGVFPDIAKYKMSDTLQTMCSSFQCLDNVITVANYDNKRSYVDFAGKLEILYPDIVPERMDLSSSIGPTRDGRIKPDIAAPGALTISTEVLSLLYDWQVSNPVNVEETGTYSRAGGTSAASPVIAGVAALYLQKNPTASAKAVKNAITACPRVDSWTGIVPNNMWGYGKADAFTTLAGCTTGIAGSQKWKTEIAIFPNPFTEQTTISYNLTALGEYSSAQVRIYDVLGKLVRAVNLTDKISHQVLHKEQLQSGSYFYTLVVDGKIIKSDKLLVL